MQPFFRRQQASSGVAGVNTGSSGIALDRRAASLCRAAGATRKLYNGAAPATKTASPTRASLLRKTRKKKKTKEKRKRIKTCRRAKRSFRSNGKVKRSRKISSATRKRRTTPGRVASACHWLAGVSHAFGASRGGETPASRRERHLAERADMPMQ